ncbi:pre-mRNA-splicing factor ISY1-like [Heracleum sosnowskyi]|uniref:Pre-mRNA-splicing factor ISY1-like n=1 Tax=Heracleum sosnowskyi TaxID=360622 RepID=A0AAD8M7U0_9APIA|nr:pre-mRNA-splicing factor ISY1-like [Heracleum sosnowskyi]
MARNQEKAQSMLNRLITKANQDKIRTEQRRPYLASQCTVLSEADKWRQQIMRDIGRKVTEIQNQGLGEHILRDLNDEINHLLREKFHWERRIFELGGPNYIEHSAKITDLEGNIINVPNASGRGPGYRYFGAAKKLPGVRELFEKPPEREKRTRHVISKGTYSSYFGLGDDEDGMLEKLERLAEEKASELNEMEVIKRKRGLESGLLATKFLREEEEDMEIRKEEFMVHVPLPDEREIKKMIAEKKKKELLELMERYESNDLLQKQSEAKAMLNIQR